MLSPADSITSSPIETINFTYANSGRKYQLIAVNDVELTYDENGIRTSKTVNGVTTYFNTKDGVILSQSDGINTR